MGIPQGVELLTKFFPHLSPHQQGQFEALEAGYRFWNSRINVISKKDIDQLYLHHVLHSLSVAKVGCIKKGMTVLDLGTGGGFPGIPLAIFYPDTKFILIDSIQKKIKVVRSMLEKLQLTHVEALVMRGERYPKRVDLVVSRAVSALPQLMQWSLPLLGAHGGLICLKGGDLTAELQAVQLSPEVYALSDFFPHPYFREKKLLFFPRVYESGVV